MVANFIELHPDQFTHFLSMFLPFAPVELLSYISIFIENAQKLRGIGIVVLIIVTIGLFGTVEESLNTIWKAVHSRSLFIRLRTFTMVMVYSPILFFASFQFRHSLRLDIPSQYSFAFESLSLLLSILAFTTLYWFVPNTKVRFKYAFLGGLIAGALFEIERYGFGEYVRLSIQTLTIYGTFGMLVLFLASLFFVSLFLLFGAQIAYVCQNFRPLLRAKKRWDRRVGDYKTYISFRIIVDIVASFIKKKPPQSLADIGRKYELTDAQARGILKSLTHAGFIHSVSEKEAYVPTRDFCNTPVKDVLDAIEDESRCIPTTPHDFARDYVAHLLKLLKQQANPVFEGLTFGRLIAELDEGEKWARNNSKNSQTLS
jgi:membrane protein